MVYILDRSMPLRMKICLATRITVWTFTTAKKILCSKWPQSGTGLGTLFVLVVLSDLPPEVSTLDLLHSHPLTRLENGMSEALTLALYMLVCRETGETPRFPGNKYFYNCVDDNTYAVSLADMTIWATSSENTKNEAFNHANGDTFIWRYFFPRIGQYFGVEVGSLNYLPYTWCINRNGQIPDQTEWPELGEKGVMANEFKMSDWAKNKRAAWERVCDKYGGKKDAFDCGTWGFFDWAVGKAWPTLLSINKARKFGWTRHDGTFESWVETFKTFENAGILPQNRNLH